MPLSPSPPSFFLFFEKDIPPPPRGGNVWSILSRRSKKRGRIDERYIYISRKLKRLSVRGPTYRTSIFSKSIYVSYTRNTSPYLFMAWQRWFKNLYINHAFIFDLQRGKEKKVARRSRCNTNFMDGSVYRVSLFRILFKPDFKARLKL